MVCEVCYWRFAEVVPLARDVRNAQLSDKVKPSNPSSARPSTMFCQVAANKVKRFCLREATNSCEVKPLKDRA